MDTSQITGTTTQNVQGHHHHRGGNIADMISKMSTGIDDAVKAGKLTQDQSTDMKKQLDAISEKLNSDPTGKGADLSQDDRQQIRKDLHDIGKQLKVAMSPKNSDGTQAGSLVDQLFKKLDSNGDQKIDKDELSSFINNLSSGAQQTNGQKNAQQQTSYSLTVETKTTFTVMG